MAPIEPADAKDEDKEELPVIKELKAIDDKYLELEREYEKEVNELMKKYTEKQKPFLEERKKILTTGSTGSEGQGGTPALKGFWLKAMQHHPAFEEYIQKWDEPVLEYLVDVEKSNLDDDPNKGFKLLFTFAENPYFTNTELWKEYHTEETNPYNGDLETQKIIVNEIDWKAGKNVTVEKVTKKVKGGGAKKAKQKKEKEEPRPSFFRNFIRHMEHGMKLTEDMMEEARQLYDGEDDDDDDDDDDDYLEALMDNDYQVGCALRDNIIPFAVRWYTGEASPDQDDDDDYDEDDEEEDDASEDDEDDSPVPKAKAKGKPAKKTKVTPKTSPDMKPSGEPKQEECKQS